MDSLIPIYEITLKELVAPKENDEVKAYHGLF